MRYKLRFSFRIPAEPTIFIVTKYIDVDRHKKITCSQFFIYVSLELILESGSEACVNFRFCDFYIKGGVLKLH